MALSGASLFLEYCKLMPNDADSAVIVLMDAREVFVSNCILSGCCGPGGCVRVVIPRTQRLVQSDSDRFVLLRCIENTFDNCTGLPFIERHLRSSSDAEELCWLRDMCIFKGNRFADSCFKNYN